MDDNRTTTNTANLAEFYPIYLQLPPSKIVELKHILESYDELGVLRTLNRKSGVVVILALQDSRSHLEQLIESVKAELQIAQIPAPEEASEDWLINVMAAEDEQSWRALLFRKFLL